MGWEELTEALDELETEVGKQKSKKKKAPYGVPGRKDRPLHGEDVGV